MFDRCRHWRHKLTLYTDDLLPESQITALELHLAHCSACRASSEADAALRDALRFHKGIPSSLEKREFEERVLKRLRLPLPAYRGSWLSRLRGSMPFLNQMISGAVFTTALAGLCLFVNLHSSFPKTESKKVTGLAQVKSTPPVPLSSLLQTPNPRAAMLWTAPNPSEKSEQKSKAKWNRSGSPHSATDTPKRGIS